MLFKTKYGYFQKDGREFVITTPYTPTAWVNYLTNGHYTALVTPTGGGYSWVGESGFNRILRENITETLITDTPGRYLYIKDLSNGEFFSNTFQPVGKGENFQAVHSLGWTLVKNEYQGILAETTFFVPLSGDYEIWAIRLSNKSSKKRSLRLTTYCEFVLGNYSHDILENSFASFFATSKRIENALFFTKKRWELPAKTVSYWDKWAFITSSLPFDQFEVSKKDFIGFGRNLSSPAAMITTNPPQGVLPGTPSRCPSLHLSSKEKTAENMVGALSFPLELKVGESRQLTIVVGVVNKPEELQNLHKLTMRPHSQFTQVELEKVNKFWDEYINKVWVETPDPALNIWMNYWGKYQTYINANWSEMDSFYIGGRGVFGFRDTAQHIWASLPFEQKLYEKQLRFLLSHQFTDGSVPHAVRLVDDQHIITEHSDDTNWLGFAILNYLEETGNLAFLKNRVPFLGEDVREYREAQNTVLDHLLKATDYTLAHCSKRSLPLHRTADWNDALVGGHLGKGESLLVAGLLGFNLHRLLRLLKKLGLKDKARYYEQKYQKMREVINKECWDKEWFIRATTDEGELIGSRKNSQGKIFLDSNTLLILSGYAGNRAKQVLKSIEKVLETPYGPEIFSPAYTRENKDRGIISQFMPGAKENAAIFNHPIAWYLIALCQEGLGEKAYQLLEKVLPLNRYHQNPDLYQVEPYVFSEFIFGRESDKFGRGSFSWVTGSAEWFFRGILDYFLGLRPDYHQLIFDPKVPKNWSFKVKRLFQGKIYHAEYTKGKTSLKT